MPLFSSVANIFFSFFSTTKSLKKHPQKLLRKTQIHFFSLLPWLPKRPKQKNSRFKMWLIEKLYIELGPPLQFASKLPGVETIIVI